MLIRWYAVGAFSPFFRAHAHIDTKRREPYLFDEPYKSIARDILRLRYSMLPIWYTAFREASVTGLPVVRYVLSRHEALPNCTNGMRRSGRTMSCSPRTRLDLKSMISSSSEDLVCLSNPSLSKAPPKPLYTCQKIRYDYRR